MLRWYISHGARFLKLNIFSLLPLQTLLSFALYLFLLFSQPFLLSQVGYVIVLLLLGLLFFQQDSPILFEFVKELGLLALDLHELLEV